MSNEEITKKINILFDNMNEFDKLFETLGIYLDSIIYLLIQKKITSDEELQSVLQTLTTQSNLDEKIEQSVDVFGFIGKNTGFMNPTVGEA